MRVCLVTQTASRAGYGLFTALRGTAVALEESGCDVWVAAGRDRYTEQDRPLWTGVEVRPFGFVGPSSLGIAPALRPWFRKQAPFDIISLHGVWSAMNASAVHAARVSGASTLLTPQGMLDSWALARSRWKKTLARVLYANHVLRAVDCFHVFSEAEAVSLRQLGLRAPIAVIPNGVSLPALSANGQSRQRTLLFLGRLHVKKGIRELIEAWNVVGSEAGSWRLVVAGPDELGLLEELKRAVQVSNIEFVGEVFGEQKEALLRHADAFVLPSHSEGFPMAVLEAWSYGKPVVMTDACNIPAGFERDAALRVEPNVPSLRDGLRRLVQLDDRALSEIGARGRLLVEQRYAWARVARDLQDVYGWLRGTSTRPDTIRLP